MKTKSLVALLLVLSLGIAVFAQKGPRGGPPLGATAGTTATAADPLAGVQTALNLSATQVTAVQAILNLRMQDEQTAQANLKAKRDAFNTLQRQSPAASAAELGAALQAVQNAELALKAINDKFILDFEALLTAAQKTVLADTRAAATRIQALARLGLVGDGPGGLGGPGGRGGRGGPGGPPPARP